MGSSGGRGLAVALVAAAWGCTFDSSGVGYDDAQRVDARIADAAADATPDATEPDALVAQTSLEVDDIRLVFGEVASDRVQSFRWSASDGGWTMERPTAPLGGIPRWTINAVSPDGRGVELLAALTQNGASHTLHLLRRDGDDWVTDWDLTSEELEGSTRGFDVEFEALSGDGLVVFADGSHTPAYRTRVGEVWSAAASLPLNDGPGDAPDPNSGAVRWIELSRRPGSDQIALAYADSDDDLVALVWDGDSWVGDSTRTLETELKRNGLTGEVSNRAFDLAYTALSGDLVVAWGTSGTSDFTYAVRRPITGQWYPESEHVSGVISGESHFVDLAAAPASDRVAGGFYDLGDGTERLGLGIWDGTAWQDTGEYDSQTLDVNDTGTGDFAGAVGWLAPDSVAVATYADDQLGTLDWARWSQGSGWGVQTDIALATKGFTESFQLATTAGDTRMLVVCSDSNRRLFASTYDGEEWQRSNLGAPLTTSVASVITVPFSLATRTR